MKGQDGRPFYQNTEADEWFKKYLAIIKERDGLAELAAKLKIDGFKERELLRTAVLAAKEFLIITDHLYEDRNFADEPVAREALRAALKEVL